jgi:nitroreductase
MMAVVGLSVMSACKTQQKHQGTCVSVLDLLEKRSSGYAYDATRPVTQEQIASLMHAAQLTPSSYNDQPWYFIIGDRTTNPEGYAKIFNTLVEANQKWAHDAPLLVVVIAHINSHNGAFNRWAEYDTGAAAMNMTLQAAELGLMVHSMGGFKVEALKGAFGMSADYKPLAVMAIGYAKTESAPRKKERKQIQENFFMGKWLVK